MIDPYQHGYSQGVLSEAELAELGHTVESYLRHIEQENGANLNDPNLPQEQREYYRGLIDGARVNTAR